MATTEDEDVPVEEVTVLDHLGNMWLEARETPTRAAAMAYGGPSRSLWPLFLLGVVMTALQVRKPVASVLGALATTALAVWLAGREVKR